MPAEAAAQLAELERSAKNRSENVMIVDLVRNDLSRVCVPGTVTRPRPARRRAPPGRAGTWSRPSRAPSATASTDGDLIRAAFPPGSVTGAPKVRALEIIDELELAPREAYTGAIGYRSPVAGLELNVAIRTFEFAAGRCWLGAGGGIVADSDPAAEYAECLIKATPLLTAIGARLDVKRRPPEPAIAADALARLTPRPSAGVFSSLLVTDGQTRGLADHLARLASSVRDLYGKDLPAGLKADLAACLASAPTGRLRITVRPVGGPLQATIEIVPLRPAPATGCAAAITLRPVIVAGGIGGRKWRDRRLLAELAARAGPAADAAGADHRRDRRDPRDRPGERVRGHRRRAADPARRRPPAARHHPGRGHARGPRPRDQGRPEAADPRPAGQRRPRSSSPTRSRASCRSPPIDGCPASWPPGPVAATLAAALAARPPDRHPSRHATPPTPATPPVAAATVALPPRAPSELWDPPGQNCIGHSGSDAPLSEVGPGATPHALEKATRPLVVLIDNYDSFTWNLAHLLSTSGAQVEVVRNDEVTAAEVAAAGPAGVVISPGPCAPAEAGISVEAVRSLRRRRHPAARHLPGPPGDRGRVRGGDHQGAPPGARPGLRRRPRRPRRLRRPADPFPATRYHSLIIDEPTLPPDLVITARTGPLPMGVRHAAAPVEGVQFHPESILTAHGAVLIANFVKSTVRSI